MVNVDEKSAGRNCFREDREFAGFAEPKSIYDS
jgi:hypothetical protein